jgi:spermidine/putrescine transport system substrate-binding protein
MPEQDLDRLVERMLDGDVASRRAFFKRMGTAGFALTGASTFLAACGGIEGAAKKTAAPTSVNHPKTPLDRLSISNWPLYIDKKTNKEFVSKFGVKDFKYSEDINDNEEFFGKVRQPLAAGQDTGRDLMVLTDWMAARCIRLGYCTPMDKGNIPNAKNLSANLQHPTWDKDRSYSLPWQSGMTIIGYDPRRTGRKLTSIKDLFDPKFKGRVSMLSDARDASNFIMMMNGKDPATAKIGDVLDAIDYIDQQNRKGQIRRFTGNDYSNDLTKGNLWVAQAYSGDIIQLQADNPHLEYVIPEEGATLWTDNMLMPAKAKDPYAAETYMNYVYTPEVAAQIAAYVAYVSPVEGAQQVLQEKDPKLASNELIFPPAEVRAKLHPFPNLNENDERQMNESMQAVIGA